MKGLTKGFAHQSTAHCALSLVVHKHNSHECRKWDRVGNLEKEFKSQSKVIPRGAEKGARVNYSQLFNENMKLKASSNRAKKALEKGL